MSILGDAFQENDLDFCDDSSSSSTTAPAGGSSSTAGYHQSSCY